ncbi:MAG: tyrosine-type recombinase/integrase [Vulcanimicrobiota bacterium]
METKTSPFLSVDSFFLRARVEGISKGRIQNYEIVLRSFSKFLGVKSLDEITRDEIRGYLLHLEERKLAKPTIALHYDVLHTFFTFCKREEILQKSPMDLLKPPRLPKQFPYVFSDSQVQSLLKAPDQKIYEGLRNYVMLLTFLDTGIRRSELIKLKLRDINLQERSMRVLGKGDRERIVYMGKTLVKALHKWLQIRGLHDFEEAVFISKRGEGLEKRYLDKVVQRLGKKAGISGTRCSPHTLRHTFATNYIRNGGDPFSLQQLLGHSDIKTCMIYVHMAGVALREAHAKYSPVDRML